MSSPPAQLLLQDLERRVDELEKAQTDQLFSNVLSLSAEGALEARLSGILEALGIVFPREVPGQRRIDWKEGNTVVERIEGAGEGAQRLSLLANTATGGKAAVLELIGGPIEEAQGIKLEAGAKSATLLTGSGLSSFLQLAVAAAHYVNFGKTNLVWANSTDSELLTIEHGLPKAPLVVLTAYGAQPAAKQLVETWASTFGAANFKAGAHSSTEVNGTVNNALNWLAIA